MQRLMNKLAVGILATSVLTAPLMAHAEKVLRFGHDNKQDMFENPAAAFTGVFKNIVESASNGSIKVEIYPSNQLGSAKEHVQMVRDGVMQGTLASVGAMASYYPRIGVMNVPFAFDSNAATYEVLDGPFGKAMADDMEKQLGNVKVLGFPDTGGFFSITNSKRPITTLDDFKGVRIRTMTLPAHEKLIQSLGGEAYPLAWGEVYSALQTGVIDGQMNPVPTVTFAHFDEVQKYLTLTNHLFSPYTLLLNKDFYDSLTDDEKRIVSYAAESGIVASRGVSRVIEASDRGLVGLQKSMKINALSPEVRAKLRETSQPAVLEQIRQDIGADGEPMLDLFLDEVKKANAHNYMQ
ncbi:C4-dicarboxylate ABC transporter substrate-binding protein [Pokkaliibacter plantistimulans]|uniref:C4-dicarboxylate ABC transporter substrate-binding protein n=1 Tax=Proteobacteria bacterium 228 TaxID=2083153 RepID=A0A2S5KNT4_9PROT|nr:DctP family TRAP transporter solute-binding subunit [Pokkaliibacter plantistimulans]PPC76471.1 C4-dicarboxylate ABC transporter substrate-binding protein [Pokkaliibacter plantistimulans]